MRMARLALIAFYLALPASLFAGINSGDLPSANWYVHVDLSEMRSGDAGRELYAWLDDEVFNDLREEYSFDADQEVDSITALATADGGTVVVIDGEFTQQTEDRILAIAAMAGEFNTLKHAGKDYFQIEEESHKHGHQSFDEISFISLAVDDKLLVTSSEQQMQAMLGNGGRISGDYSDTGAMLVLRGQKSFIQAGMQTEMFDEDFGWDSNLLQNTKQLGLLISDEAGDLAVEAQLVATEASVANSLASIVRGLIGLQALSGEVDPELSRLLNNTNVAVDGSVLTVKIAVDPEVLVKAID